MLPGCRAFVVIRSSAQRPVASTAKKTLAVFDWPSPSQVVVAAVEVDVVEIDRRAEMGRELTETLRAFVGSGWGVA
jgi:hypothetical protein